MTERAAVFDSTCPLPVDPSDTIRMAHGGGGRLTRRLIDEVFAAELDDGSLDVTTDGATFRPDDATHAFTTDSYVVRPLFFPGGDIGSLAVFGTVNDLAMCGARPVALSVGFILEEGLPIDTLRRVVRSMRAAADRAGAPIVTGDTKVVDRGAGDGLYVNTAGVGRVLAEVPPSPVRVRPGDRVVLSGDLGRHGVAILGEREGLGFESALESDAAPLVGPISALYHAGVEPHALRDLTRGGLSAGLNEIAQAAGVTIELDETAIPVCDAVRGACELLGLDPLEVANEGRFVAFVPEGELDRTLVALRTDPLSAEARVIGTVNEGRDADRVVMRTRIGSRCVVDVTSGELLPRIC